MADKTVLFNGFELYVIQPPQIVFLGQQSKHLLPHERFHLSQKFILAKIKFFLVLV